jgi:hypothetical protein
MLTLLTYRTKQDLQQQLITRLGGQAAKFVTPFPAKADALRLSWAHRSQTDVLTLSKFLKDLFAALPEKMPPPLRKSRLLLQLNSFRHLLPQLQQVDFGTFKTSYQVFSDLRAYTDAPEFPDELLASFDETVALMAQLFHQGCQRAGILDEHAGVFELTARLRASEGLELPGKPVVVFDGFTFMTPAQLSFIEALAIRHQVIVPLPELVYEHGHPLDWPKALELAASEIKRTEAPQATAAQLQVSFYPSGMMVEALRQWRSQRSGEVQLILGAKNPTEIHLQQIPFSDAFQKTPVDITAEARDVVFAKWEKQLNGREWPGKTLIDWINADKRELTTSKDLARMRELAVIVLVEKAIQDVPNCLEAQPLNLFFLSLLREVIALDAPRSSMISLMPDAPRLHIFNLKNFHGVKESLPTAICLDGSLGAIKSDHRPFSPEMEKTLAKLGPVRRPELEFLFLQAELSELWPHPQLEILVEDGLLKHDLGWKRLFEALKYEKKPMELLQATHEVSYEFFMPSAGAIAVPDRLSATRLQDFIDCPRKYHADRVEKLIPRIESSLELEPMTLGTIEHTLVEECWQKGKEHWRRPGQLEADALKLVMERDVLSRLSPALRAAAVSEAAICARNGLERLALLAQAIPGIKFQFEVELTAPGRTGFIDCLGIADDILVLLDFKRSKGANPALGGWEEGYPKIQLWFYLAALRQQGLLRPETRLAVGYLFFKDLDKSWLAAHPTLASAIGAQVEGWANEWSDNEAALDRYTSFETQVIEQLRSEKIFAPAPRDIKNCRNCALRALCPLGGEEKEE